MEMEFNGKFKGASGNGILENGEIGKEKDFLRD